MYNKKHTEETKQKMRLARILRKQKLGYINSPETRKKLSDKRRGLKISKEWSANMSKALKGKVAWKENVTRV